MIYIDLKDKGRALEEYEALRHLDADMARQLLNLIDGAFLR